MTTTPLSMREGHGQTLSGGDATLAPVRVDDDGKLDALIDSVTETIASRDKSNGESNEILLEEPSADDGDTWRDFKAKLDDPDTAEDRGSESELDRALKTAVDRRASQEAESADFRQSKEWRDLLDQRYGGRFDIGDVLDAFGDWHERFKADPRKAADAIASVYLEQPAYVLPATEHSPKSDPPAIARGAGAGQSLDGVLVAAIDRHHGQGDGEQRAFAESTRHRAALKEMFPGVTYAEACRRVVMLDADLHRDPIGTAARLAATYHMPVTSSQQVAAEQRDVLAHDAQSVTAASAQDLPGLAEVEDDVIAVLGRPDFLHGPDMQHNLLRAYRVVQLARQQDEYSAARKAPI